MVIFRPPPELATVTGWHNVRTHIRELERLQFDPGIDVWKDEDGQRWTSEAAGELGWQWLSEAEPPAPLRLRARR
jgi:hypothetical protein